MSMDNATKLLLNLTEQLEKINLRLNLVEEALRVLFSHYQMTDIELEFNMDMPARIKQWENYFNKISQFKKEMHASSPPESDDA